MEKSITILLRRGFFQNHIIGIGKAATGMYYYYKDGDSPEHTMSQCSRWRRSKEDIWNLSATYIKSILKTKEIDERERRNM